MTHAPASPTGRPRLRCVIVGEGTLPLQCADTLLDRGHEVVALVATEADAGAWAQTRGVELLPPAADLSTSLAATLAGRPYDYLLSVVNMAVLREPLLSQPVRGAVNYHDAPLPRYAGLYSTSWAILNGESRHGVSWHEVIAELDAGRLLKQREFDVTPADTALTLNTKGYEAAIASFAELVAEWEDGTNVPREQDLALRTYHTRFQRPICVVRWDQPAAALDALVRALEFGLRPNRVGVPTLLVGDAAYACRGLRVVDVPAGDPAGTAAAPGTILAVREDALVVATADRPVEVSQLSTLAGAPVTIGALCAMHGLTAGARLATPAVDATDAVRALHEAVCRYEPFWTPRLAAPRPPALPSIGAEQWTAARAPRGARRVVPVAVPSALDARPAAERVTALAAAASAYLRRVNGGDVVDVDVELPAVRARLGGTGATFRATLPSRVTCAAEDTFAAVVDATARELAAVEKRGPLSRDLFLREPALRTEEARRWAVGLPVALAVRDADPADETAVVTFAIAPDGARAWLSYDSATLGAATAAHVAAHWGTIAAAGVADPARPIAELPLLGAAERTLLLETWNATDAAYPTDATLADLFEAQAARTPNAIAVSFGDESLTYAELDARADRLAAALRRRGVGPNVLVALHMTRSPALVVALLGVAKAGGAYVPVDATYPAARVEYMIGDARCPIVLASAALAGQVPPTGAEVCAIDEDGAIVGEAPNGETPNGAAGRGPRTVQPEDLAYVIYTSGSTGRPKGAMIEHRGLVNYLTWAARAYEVHAGAGAPVHSSLSFDLTVTSLLTPLVSGRTAFLVPEGPGVEGLADALRANRTYSLVKLTPAHLDALRLELADVDLAGRVRVFVIGGEALLGESLAFWQSRMPGTVFVNEYGPTETVVGCCVEFVTSDQRIAGAVPIGKPIANTTLYVLDAQGAPVPAGVKGELYIGGDGVGRGYWHNAERSAQSFLADPFAGGAARMYRTGDLACWGVDGVMEFFGRIDDQVKVRGYRIELGEIERVLEAHPTVRDVAVTARQDGPGHTRLVAYVVPEDEPVTATSGDTQVARWSEVFESSYANAEETGDAVESAFNIAGWLSSYDHQPILAAEMREWVENVCARILALKPRRVLEIGCGTGLLLLRIAPHVAHYHGVDFSATALDWLRQDPAYTRLGNVSLTQARADEVADRVDGTFDLVIINSVAQYFPSVEYLMGVLSASCARIADGGALFVGDVRSLPLLETFHTSVALHQAPDDLSVGELRDRVGQRLAHETELVIDPAFFDAVRAELPRITEAQVYLEAGAASNELTKYRYDALLRVGGTGADVPARATRTAATEEEIAALLADTPPVLRVADLRDARVAADQRAHALVAAAAAIDTVAAVRARLAATAPALGEVAPQRLIALHTDYDVELRRAASGAAGAFDAVFRHRAHAGEAAPVRAAEPVLRAWRDFVHHGAPEAFALERVETWRSHLRELLPNYMVPAVFVRLDALPLTPNGKVDRRALPEPVTHDEAAGPYVAPRTPTEAAAAEVWAGVLQLRRVGVTTDVFRLGANSLLAMRALAQLRERFGVTLALRVAFEEPTVAGFAARLDEALSAPRLSTEDAPKALGLDEAPLSFGQELLWLLERMHPGVAAYNRPELFTVRGPLDVAALRGAVGDVVQRHPALRTAFTECEGDGVQRVAATADVPWTEVDLRARPATEREPEAARVAQEETRRPFDLARAPLLRVAVIRLADDVAQVLIVHHHLVSDGWSRGILLREIGAAYRARQANAPLSLAAPALAAPALRYTDYAAWERARRTNGGFDAPLAYWREQLRDVEDVLELPTDRPRPAVRGFAGAETTVVWPSAMLDAVHALGRAHGTTLFMTLFAAYQAVLGRYSGQERFVVGTPVAGRTHASMEDVIGYFANVLALRADLQDGPTFAELLRRVRTTCLGAFEHQDVPFEVLVSELGQPLSASHTPLFQVMFLLENTAPAELRLTGTDVARRELDAGWSTYDLWLIAAEAEGGLRLTMQYRSDLFDAETIDRMLEHLRVLVSAAAQEPTRRVPELPLLTAPEWRQLAAWNATDVPLGGPACIHELVAAQAARTPDAVAAVDDAGHLTYAQLDAQANQLAHHLIALGVTRGALVGLAVERSTRLMVALLGVMKAGAAYVPLDPGYPTDRLAFMLRDSGARVLVTEDALRDRLPAFDGVVTRLDGDAAAIAAQPTDAPATGTTSDDLAYVIYTSGSTGTPKGAMLPHRAVANYLRWMQHAYALDGRDCVMQKAPVSFDASVWELYLPLIAGARVLLARPDGHRDPAYLLMAAAAHHVTVLQFVPSLLGVLLDTMGFAAACADLRLLVLGGEALPGELAARTRAQLPDIAIHNLYGPTEAAVYATAWELPRDFAGGTVPIGRPIANDRVYVVARGGSEPVPVGVAGELCIGGAGVGAGYHNRPDLTADRFVPDPFVSDRSARMYRTGDLARWRADGTLEFLGRIDHQVKIRGFRVELGEIETALRAIAGVKDGVVVQRTGPGGEARLAAYVVAEPDAALAMDIVRTQLAARLPDHMVPSAIVVLDALPLNANGKLDRRALPEPTDDEAPRPYLAPRTSMEETVANVWTEVLGRERVSVDDDFFALGGHSLLGMRILARLSGIARQQLPLRLLFEARTVEALAAVVGQEMARADEAREMEEMLAALAALSDEDAERLLGTSADDSHTT